MSLDPYDSQNILVSNHVEAIRKRPGMYFGSTDERGLFHLFLEVFSNAVDAVIRNENPVIKVHSIYPEIIIEDNGVGFPFDEECEDGKNLVELYITTLHSNRSRDNHAPHIHLRYLYGVGLAAVNAVASQFSIESWCKNKQWSIFSEKGIITKPAEVIKQGQMYGSTITFKPDEEIFSVKEMNPSRVRAVLFEAAHLFPGISIHFNGEIFSSKNGLSDLIYIISDKDGYFPSSFNEPFTFSEKIDDFYINISLIGSSEKPKDANWLSWVNGNGTPFHGSHVKGIKKALKKVNWKIGAGLVHLIHYNPCYAGPTKGSLELPYIVDKIRDHLIPQLNQYLEKVNKS